MGLFGFGSKKRLKESIDLSRVITDMHSHLIPGIDDGAKDMENSIELIEKLASLGYKKLLTTPHIMSDLYKNNTDIIQSGRDKVRDELAKRAIDIEFDCSAEYFTDGHFQQLIKQKDLMPFGKNYILFELGFVSKPPMMDEVIYELQMAGYRPILAHPERYTYMHRNFDTYEELVNKGVHLQLNIGSLTDSYGNGVRKIAKKLIDENLITFLGTDCHHFGHTNMISHIVYDPALKQLVDSGKLLNASI